jgi:hypothetical protein
MDGLSNALMNQWHRSKYKRKSSYAKLSYQFKTKISRDPTIGSDFFQVILQIVFLWEVIALLIKL